MRRLLLTMAMMTATAVMTAQNVQLHYDLGHTIDGELSGRPNVTTTVEMFKPDALGSTFMFTDIDYYADGAAGAYWEIAREFNFTKNKQWAAHVEYNGGATTVEHTSIATRIQHALLAGVAWNWNSADFSKTFSLQAMFKQYFKGQHRDGFSGFQATTVWGDTFAHGLCTFSGFIDLWYDKNVRGKLITLAEPQFWFNLNAIKGMEKVKLSLGTEVEVSNNFVYDDKGQNDKFYVIPTVAAKWTF